MTKKLFTSALFAGLVAGLIAVLLQFSLMESLILEGEEYETGAKVHFVSLQNTADISAPSAEETHDHATHEHEDEDENLVARFALAFFADFIIFVGWALILVAGFAVAERFGHKVTLKNGLLWGGAGFIAVHLAPGVGLAPELPGIPAADLQARQIWWVATVLSSAAALACFAYGRSAIYVAIGLVLLVAPHLIGAPRLEAFTGLAPPELSGEFVARSFAVSMATWAVLGLAAGYFWNRPAEPA